MYIVMLHAIGVCVCSHAPVMAICCIYVTRSGSACPLCVRGYDSLWFFGCSLCRCASLYCWCNVYLGSRCGYVSACVYVCAYVWAHLWAFNVCIVGVSLYGVAVLCAHMCPHLLCACPLRECI